MSPASPTPQDALIRLETKSLLSAQQHALWDNFLHRQAPAAARHSPARVEAPLRRKPTLAPSTAVRTRAGTGSAAAEAGGSRGGITQPTHGAQRVPRSTAAAASQHAPPAARGQEQNRTKPMASSRQRGGKNQGTVDSQSMALGSKAIVAAAARHVGTAHPMAVNSRDVPASARVTSASGTLRATGVLSEGSAAGAATIAIPFQRHTSNTNVSPAPALAPLRTPRPALTAPSSATAATAAATATAAASSRAPTLAPYSSLLRDGVSATSTARDQAAEAAAAAAFAAAANAKDVSSPRLFATHLSTWWRQHQGLQICAPQQQRLQRIQSPRAQTGCHNSKFDTYNRNNATSKLSRSSKQRERKESALHRATRAAIGMHRRRSLTEVTRPEEGNTVLQCTSGVATEPKQAASSNAAAASVKAKATTSARPLVAAPWLQRPDSFGRLDLVRAESIGPDYAASTSTQATSRVLLHRQQQPHTGQLGRDNGHTQSPQTQQQAPELWHEIAHEQSHARLHHIPQQQHRHTQMQPHEAENQQRQQHLLPVGWQQQSGLHQQAAHADLDELYQQQNCPWQDPQARQLSNSVEQPAAPAWRSVVAAFHGRTTALPSVTAVAVSPVTAAGGPRQAADGRREPAICPRGADGGNIQRKLPLSAEEVDVEATVEAKPNAGGVAASSLWGTDTAAQHQSHIPRVQLSVIPSWQKQQQQYQLQQRQREQQQASHLQHPQPFTQRDLNGHQGILLRPMKPSDENASEQQHLVRKQQNSNPFRHQDQPQAGRNASSEYPRQRPVSSNVPPYRDSAVNEASRTEQQHFCGQQQFANVLRRELAQAVSKASQQTVRGMRGELQGLRRDFDTLVEHVKHQQRVYTPPVPTEAAVNSFAPPMGRSTLLSATETAGPFPAEAVYATGSAAFGSVPGAAAGPFAAPLAAAAANPPVAGATFPFAASAATAPFGGPGPSFSVPPIVASYAFGPAAAPYPLTRASFPDPYSVFTTEFEYPSSLRGPSTAAASVVTDFPPALKRSRSTSVPTRQSNLNYHVSHPEVRGGDERSISSDTAADVSSVSSPVATLLAREWLSRAKKKQQRLALREHREYQQLRPAQPQQQQNWRQQQQRETEQHYHEGHQMKKQTRLLTPLEQQRQFCSKELEQQDNSSLFKNSILTLDVAEKPVLDGRVERNEGSLQRKCSNTRDAPPKSVSTLSFETSECNARTILSSLNELSQNLETLALASAAAIAGPSSSRSAQVAALLRDTAAAAGPTGSAYPTTSVPALPNCAFGLGAREKGEHTRIVPAVEKTVAPSHVNPYTRHRQQHSEHQQEEARGPRVMRFSEECLQRQGLRRPHRQQTQVHQDETRQDAQNRRQHHPYGLSLITEAPASAGMEPSHLERQKTATLAPPLATATEADMCASLLDEFHKSSPLKDAGFSFAPKSALPPTAAAACAALPIVPVTAPAAHSAQLSEGAASKLGCAQPQCRPAHNEQQQAFHNTEHQLLLHEKRPHSDAETSRNASVTASVPRLQVCAATTERPAHLQRIASAPASVVGCIDVSSTHPAASHAVPSAFVTSAAFPRADTADRSSLLCASSLHSTEHPVAMGSNAFFSRPVFEESPFRQSAAAVPMYSPASNKLAAAFGSAALGRETEVEGRCCSEGATAGFAPVAPMQYDTINAAVASANNVSGPEASGRVFSAPSSTFCAQEGQQLSCRELLAGLHAAHTSVRGDAAAAAERARFAAKGRTPATPADGIAEATAPAAEAARTVNIAAAAATSREAIGGEGAAVAAARPERDIYSAASFSAATSSPMRRSLTSSSLLLGRSGSCTSKDCVPLCPSASYRAYTLCSSVPGCSCTAARTLYNDHSSTSGGIGMMRRLSHMSRQPLQPQRYHPEGSSQLRRTSWPTTAGSSHVAVAALRTTDEYGNKRLCAARMCSAGDTSVQRFNRSNSASYSGGSSFSVRSSNTGQRRCRRCEACGVPPPTIERLAAVTCSSEPSSSSVPQSKSRICGDSGTLSGCSGAEVRSSHIQTQIYESATATLQQQPRQLVYQRNRNRSNTEQSVAGETQLAAAHTVVPPVALGVAGVDRKEAKEAASCSVAARESGVAAPANARQEDTSRQAHRATIVTGKGAPLHSAPGGLPMAKSRSHQEMQYSRREESLRLPPPAEEAPSVAPVEPKSPAAALATPEAPECRAVAAAPAAGIPATVRGAAVGETCSTQQAAASRTPADRAVVSTRILTKAAAAQTTPRTGADGSVAAANAEGGNASAARISSEDQLATAFRIVASAAAAELFKERRPSSVHTSSSSRGSSSLSASLCSCSCHYCGRHASRKARSHCCCSTANSRSYSETSYYDEDSSLSSASSLPSPCCSPFVKRSPAAKAPKSLDVRRGHRPSASARDGAAAVTNNREMQQQVHGQRQQQIHHQPHRDTQQQQHTEMLLSLWDGASTFSWQMLLQQQILLQQQLMQQLQQPQRQRARCTENCTKSRSARSSSAASRATSKLKNACSHACSARETDICTAAADQDCAHAAAVRGSQTTKVRDVQSVGCVRACTRRTPAPEASDNQQSLPPPF